MEVWKLIIVHCFTCISRGGEERSVRRIEHVFVETCVVYEARYTRYDIRHSICLSSRDA